MAPRIGSFAPSTGCARDRSLRLRDSILFCVRLWNGFHLRAGVTLLATRFHSALRDADSVAEPEALLVDFPSRAPSCTSLHQPPAGTSALVSVRDVSRRLGERPFRGGRTLPCPERSRPPFIVSRPRLVRACCSADCPGGGRTRQRRTLACAGGQFLADMVAMVHGRRARTHRRHSGDPHRDFL